MKKILFPTLILLFLLNVETTNAQFLSSTFMRSFSLQSKINAERCVQSYTMDISRLKRQYKANPTELLKSKIDSLTIKRNEAKKDMEYWQGLYISCQNSSEQSKPNNTSNANTIGYATIKDCGVIPKQFHNGKQGITFKASFEIHKLKGQDCFLFIWLKDSKGNFVKSNNSDLSNTSGDFMKATKVTPQYDGTSFTDYEVFIPYIDLHKAKVNGSLQAVFDIRYKSQQLTQKACDKKFVFLSNTCGACNESGICGFCKGSKMRLSYYRPTPCSYCKGTGICDFCIGIGASISCFNIEPSLAEPNSPNMNMPQINFETITNDMGEAWYQEQYNWNASQAAFIYRNLTVGYTNSNGEQKDYRDSSWGYTSSETSMREQYVKNQLDMKRIRQEAMRYKHYLTTSEYETKSIPRR